MPGHFNTYLCTLHQQSGRNFSGRQRAHPHKIAIAFLLPSVSLSRSEFNVHICTMSLFHRFSIMRALKLTQNFCTILLAPSVSHTRRIYSVCALKCTPLNSTGLMANVLCRSRLIVVNSLDYFTHILPRTTLASVLASLEQMTGLWINGIIIIMMHTHIRKKNIIIIMLMRIKSVRICPGRERERKTHAINSKCIPLIFN